MIKKIGLVLKDDRQAALPVVEAINEFLKGKDITTSEDNLERAILAKGEYLRDAALLVAPIA